MDAETVEHCFEPFYTRKDRSKGTGLGLSTVYWAVTQAGGDIAAESTLGVGSTFTVRLPAAAATGTAARDRVGDGNAALRILVVDDDPDVRAIVADMLELEGHEVVVAADGASALELFDDADPDVLITDVVMPGMRGTELAEIVVTARPDVRVVLMSSHVDDERALDHRATEGALFLAKPFSSAALVDVLAECARLPVQGSNR